ncbi:hypothetical protein [Nodosilinea sp. E11]|uniref:hypothetical protein n=1 Tax=Nodosilinea sp. E11 TaxID=3037479 RepID=UPI002934C09E|nr:hypothetical protein [Nodosilinea sp. E11]WOD41153.1 hypothetical protein RRF56_10155 [Nodosilinea sp. E11]
MSQPNPNSGTSKSVEIVVGLLVPPLLLGILAARALTDGLTQAGLASEQIFSGERLPNLNLHHPAQAAAAAHTTVE